jgi:hypothetical protein
VVTPIVMHRAIPRRFTFKSSAGAASQILRPCIPLGAGCAEGSAKTPLVMDRKIRRPSGALHATGTARIIEPATHLIERCLGILSAEPGVRRVSRG